MSRRYWLSLGLWDSAESGKEFHDQVGQELLTIDGGVEDTPNGLVFKTEDLDTALNVRSKAIGVLQWYPQLQPWLRNHDEEEVMPINTQPQCPSCGRLGRFSERCCPDCGTQLLGTDPV